MKVGMPRGEIRLLADAYGLTRRQLVHIGYEKFLAANEDQRQALAGLYRRVKC